MSYDESERKEQAAKTVPILSDGIGTRISDVASMYESRKQAAEAAGVALSSLQRWIAEDGVPAFDSVARLAAGQSISLDWLATGRGQKSTERSTPLAPVDETYAYIPLYDAAVSAGHGSWNESANILTKLAFTSKSLRRQGLCPSSLSAIRITGDSMEPLLVDGDTVLIDHDRQALEGEGVYVVHLDGHLYAKRLQRQFDGSIHILSENKAYRDMAVPKEQLNDLQIIGQVVWAGGWI